MTPEAVLDLFRKDLDPLYSAWSKVWSSGSREAITLSNDLVDLAGALLATSSKGGDARGPVATALLGQAFSVDQATQFQRDVAKLSGLRRDFAALTRVETGEPVANLFTQPTTH